MRVPRSLNRRIAKQIILKKFGTYEKVLPAPTTPRRHVPEHIKRPNYVETKPNIQEIKNAKQIQGMRNSCKLAASILEEMHSFIKPGISTDQIDNLVHNMTIAAGAYPSPLDYNGFPKSICTSVNNVVVHGIPDLRLLKNGDIVNVDITVFYKGFHGDCSKTFLVGTVDNKGNELVKVTEECLNIAINSCGPGVPFTQIGYEIYKHAKKHKLTVIPSVLGHGIGEYFHGLPEIYHTSYTDHNVDDSYDARYLPRLVRAEGSIMSWIWADNLCSLFNEYPGVMKPGMTFTIEPAITHGSEDTVLLEDGWTLLTEDGARSAQMEHTVLITEHGAEILTKSSILH